MQGKVALLANVDRNNHASKKLWSMESCSRDPPLKLEWAIRFNMEDEDIEWIRDLWAKVKSFPSLHNMKQETTPMIVIKVSMMNELEAINSVNLEKK